MRIISGTHKGRTIKTAAGMETRPTTDKVKESLFNIIGPYFDGGFALDLFAGSGGLGIEALSRGIEKAIFIDRSPKAIAIIKENIRQLQLEKRAEVYRNEAIKALKTLAKRGLAFTYIFLDPPYHKHQLVKVMEQISEGSLLSDDGMIVVEHANDVELPKEIGDFECFRTERYGITMISLYQKK